MSDRVVSFVKTSLSKERAEELIESISMLGPGGVLFCDSQEEMDFLDDLIRKGREGLIIAGVGLAPRRPI